MVLFKILYVFYETIIEDTVYDVVECFLEEFMKWFFFNMYYIIFLEKLVCFEVFIGMLKCVVNIFC